jgi:hypothetical protein
MATSTPASSNDASASTALDYSAISAISFEERNITVKMVYDKLQEIKIQLNDLSNQIAERPLPDVNAARLLAYDAEQMNAVKAQINRLNFGSLQEFLVFDKEIGNNNAYRNKLVLRFCQSEETDKSAFISENLIALFKGDVFLRMSLAGRKGNYAFKSMNTFKCLKAAVIKKFGTTEPQVTKVLVMSAFGKKKDALKKSKKKSKQNKSVEDVFYDAENSGSNSEEH